MTINNSLREWVEEEIKPELEQELGPIHNRVIDMLVNKWIKRCAEIAQGRLK